MDQQLLKNRALTQAKNGQPQFDKGGNFNQLTGMKAICNYMNRHDTTILKLIRDNDFPAKKIMGVWESDKGMIDEWRVGMIRF